MKRKNRIVLLLLLLIVCTFSFYIAKTYSKYITKVSGKVVVDAAMPILDTNLDTSTMVLLSEMKPGDEYEYDFKVTNFTDDYDNEVTINYSISIDKSSNIPVSIKLYKNGGSLDVLSNLVSSNNILGFGSKQTDNYKLVVSWNEIDNDYEYSNQTDYLDIIIHGEQVIGG